MKSMKSEVTYYIFYLKGTKDIYAYTDEKKISSVFMMQRNLGKFYYKKAKLNGQEIHNLAEDDDKYKRLAIYALDTYNDSAKEKDTILVAMTEMEHITVNQIGASFSMVDIVVNAWIPFKYFKPELQKPLTKFYYDKIYNTISASNSDIINISNEESIWNTADEIMRKYFRGIDEFNIFLDKYGRTMRQDYKGFGDNEG